MRWIFLLAALICAALIFKLDSPGWLALDILGLFVFATLTVFGFAAARIDSSARMEGSMLTPADLAEIRAQAAARSAASLPAAASTAAPASGQEAIQGSIAALRARAEARRNGTT